MPRLSRVLPGVGFAAALALVLVLARQNRALADRISRLELRAYEPYVGLFVPTFTNRTLDGAQLTVGERADSARQLIFVFTTSCPYCRASRGAWKRLASIADTLRSHRTVPIGIVLDSGDVSPYAAAFGTAIPITRFPESRIERYYRVRSVPLILILDSNGQAIYSRLGVLPDTAGVAIDSVVARMNWTRPSPATIATAVARRVQL